ncbi:hypothetical protein GCM10009731_04420 [Streptomyces globosus]
MWLSVAVYRPIGSDTSPKLTTPVHTGLAIACTTLHRRYIRRLPTLRPITPHRQRQPTAHIAGRLQRAHEHPPALSGSFHLATLPCPGAHGALALGPVLDQLDAYVRRGGVSMSFVKDVVSGMGVLGVVTR